MNPATLIQIVNGIKWVTSIIDLATQAGAAIEQMKAEFDLLTQLVVDKKPLTADQRADLQSRHASLMEADLAPLGPLTGDET